jgi:hypothetical protein
MEIRGHATTVKSRAQAYQEAHEAVLNNPYWYSDKPQMLGASFSAAETRMRTDIVIDILHRAARRRTERSLSSRYLALADRLVFCRIDRCGSAACLECLRAFQQAKAAAQQPVTLQLAKMHLEKLLCFVTIIPLTTLYPCGGLDEFNPREFNLYLLEILEFGDVIQPFASGIDFSLEKSRFGKYWQPHWHLPMWTDDPEWLKKRLLALFPRFEKHDYSVDLTEAEDLNFHPYIHKGLKINNLLRSGRTHLPELLLVLDRIKPLDLLVTHGLVLSAQDDGFKFELEPRS